MKTYTSPAVAFRGDVVRETLTSKPIFSVETSNKRAASDSSLSFGL
jgi:hypothetical protein